MTSRRVASQGWCRAWEPWFPNGTDRPSARRWSKSEYARSWSGARGSWESPCKHKEPEPADHAQGKSSGMYAKCGPAEPFIISAWPSQIRRRSASVGSRVLSRRGGQVVMTDQIVSDKALHQSVLEENIRPKYKHRLDERNRSLEIWTRRDRRIADARLALFVVLVVLGFLILRGVGIPLWWLGAAGTDLRGACPRARASPACRRSARAPCSSTLTAWRGSMVLAGNGLCRAGLPRRQAPLCRRSRPVRLGLDIREALHRTHAIRRRHARGLAAWSGHTRGDRRAA